MGNNWHFGAYVLTELARWTSKWEKCNILTQTMQVVRSFVLILCIRFDEASKIDFDCQFGMNWMCVPISQTASPKCRVSSKHRNEFQRIEINDWQIIIKWRSCPKSSTLFHIRNCLVEAGVGARILHNAAFYNSNLQSMRNIGIFGIITNDFLIYGNMK